MSDLHSLRICDLILETDLVPLPYEAFEVSEESEPVMKMKASTGPISVENATEVFKNVYHFNIYAFSDGHWVYEFRADGSRMRVETDFSHFEYCLAEQSHPEAFAFLTDLAVQCRLLIEGVITVHAACVAKNHRAVAFSAESGTGKSTRARLWIEHLGYEWVVGDRPCIRISDDKVFGVPWDGKEQIFKPGEMNLAALCEIRRSQDTYGEVLDEGEAFKFLMTQLFIPMWDPSLSAIAMSLLKKYVKTHRVLRLYCDITTDSVLKAEEILLCN